VAEEIDMKLLDKLCIVDEKGTEVAYINNGIVYVSSNGRRIGSIRGGNLYTQDGQLLGYRTPAGAVRGVGGTAPDAFMRLVKAE
jgi:hypothetical protein